MDSSISGIGNTTQFWKINQMTNNMMQRLDTNKDKALTSTEFGGTIDAFKSIDKNSDGKLDVVELNKAALIKGLDQQTSNLISSLDTNTDNALSADELKMPADVFNAIDTNGDGTANLQELNNAFLAKQAASQYRQSMNATNTPVSSTPNSIIA